MERIIYKNFLSNFKKYIAYFVGNMMGVVEFFVFWGLYSVVQKITVDSVTLEDTLEEIIIAVGVITIFSTVLMVYSMLNYMKERITDYSLFCLLGMKKRHLYGLISVEYLIGWVISLGMGLLVGRIIIELILRIWHKMFTAYIPLVSIGLPVYLDACKISVGIMISVVIVVLVWSDNKGFNHMLNGNIQKEKRPQNIYWSIAVGIGGVLIVLGYWGYQSTMFWGYFASHLEWIAGGFLILVFGGGIGLEYFRKHSARYLKNLLKTNSLYYKYQTGMMIILMFLSVHFVALSYCATEICNLLPIDGNEKYYPYQAIWLNKDREIDQQLIKKVTENYKGEAKQIPVVRVCSYGNELVGISADTYQKLTGKSVELTGKDIIYIVNEYRSSSGRIVTSGGFEYGKKGYTWLEMGSYTEDVKNYVDPSSNNPLPSHDARHLYKIKRVETGNLFGHYKLNEEAENVVVFSNKYFSEQYTKLSKKEYEPTVMTMFTFAKREKEKALSELKKYVAKYGIKDFGLTNTTQRTLYGTDEFVEMVKKENIFKITNKIFMILTLLISSIFVTVIKSTAEVTNYRKQKEFLVCMGIHEKEWEQILNTEIQILSWISLMAATFLSSLYMLMNIHVEKEKGIVYGSNIWMYWSIILCLYWLLHYVMQRVVVWLIKKKC